MHQDRGVVGLWQPLEHHRLHHAERQAEDGDARGEAHERGNGAPVVVDVGLCGRLGRVLLCPCGAGEAHPGDHGEDCACRRGIQKVDDGLACRSHRHGQEDKGTRKAQVELGVELAPARIRPRHADAARSGCEPGTEGPLHRQHPCEHKRAQRHAHGADDVGRAQDSLRQAMLPFVCAAPALGRNEQQEGKRGRLHEVHHGHRRDVFAHRGPVRGAVDPHVDEAQAEVARPQVFQERQRRTPLLHQEVTVMIQHGERGVPMSRTADFKKVPEWGCMSSTRPFPA